MNTRPTYETKAHLTAESELASWAALAWSCDMRKQDKFNQFDYLAIRGRDVFAFVEMRCRANSVKAYSTCFISVNKLANAQLMNLATGLPCLFLVRWSDAIGWANMTTQYPTILGGRNKVRDAADIEAIGEIPISEFKLCRP